jgi:phosphoglycolate phosphatase
MTSIRLLAFDLDGTLVDSSQDLADSVNAMLGELGAPPLPETEVTRMVGEGAAVLVGRALVRAGVKVDARTALDCFLKHYDERLLATTKPYPGMVETLQALRDQYSLAVLTNKPALPTMRLLEGLGLIEFFRDVIGGDTAYGRKPDPAGLLALVDRASATPQAALLIGDSPVDLATARAAGTRICLARYGFGYRFEQYGFRGDELFIDNAQALLAVLEPGSSGARGIGSSEDRAPEAPTSRAPETEDRQI